MSLPARPRIPDRAPPFPRFMAAALEMLSVSGAAKLHNYTRIAMELYAPLTRP